MSRDLLFEFWNPSISREWLKLETSNLARILITRGTNKKCKIRLKGVGKRSCDLLLEFWDSLSITRTVEARNLKFEMQIGREGY